MQCRTTYYRTEQMEKKNDTLVEQTQRNILRYIMRNSQGVNSVLPKEQELADLLGVSRVVVREALSRIRALGFIETKKKKGTVVIMPEVFGVLKLIVESGILNRESLKELYQLRLMLEIGMADFIFLNKTEEDIAALQEIVEREERATSTEESIKLDILFHSTLYHITKNKSLTDFQNLLEPLFRFYAPRTKDYRARQIVTHSSLVYMLRTGTADAFRLAMRMHLNTQFEDMEKTLENAERSRAALGGDPGSAEAMAAGDRELDVEEPLWRGGDNAKTLSDVERRGTDAVKETNNTADEPPATKQRRGRIAAVK